MGCAGRQATSWGLKLIFGRCKDGELFGLMCRAELCEAGTINIGHDNIES